MSSEKLLDVSEYSVPLAKTPAVLRAVVEDRPDTWLDSRHAPDVFSPREAVAHLLLCDIHESFIDRTRFILEPGFSLTGPELRGRDLLVKYSLSEMLEQFDKARAQRLQELHQMRLVESDLDKSIDDEELGPFTLRELLATWVAHDQYHLGQIFKSYSALYLGKIGVYQTFLNLPHFN